MSENQVRANVQKIGYLKTIFWILLVTNIIWISWLIATPDTWLMKLSGVVAVGILSAVLFRLNHEIRRSIHEIRTLGP